MSSDGIVAGGSGLLAATNRRVDKALFDNRRSEWLIVSMATMIFLSGMALLTVGYSQQNAYVTGGAALLEGFLYWPVREVLRLRRENLMLQTLPVLVAELPREEATKIIREALLERLWKD